MSKADVPMIVRQANQKASIIDIEGDLTGQVENKLMDAYTQATSNGSAFIILNCAGLEYMNSSGISLLVVLLVRIKRQQQRLLVCHLNEHYRHILELTRLAEVITIFETEADAIAATV